MFFYFLLDKSLHIVYYIFCLQDIYAKAGMAQLVARHIGNVEVTGSIPVASLLKREAVLSASLFLLFI